MELHHFEGRDSVQMSAPGTRSLFAEKPLSARVAEAGPMRIELLRCAPNTTVRCEVSAAGLTLVWASQPTGRSQIRLGANTAVMPLGGHANLCFFPDGQEADGAITVGGEADCVSIFLDPAHVPIQLRETLRQPLVGFRHDALGRAFRELTRELAAPDASFPVFSQGWALQALAYVARVTARPAGTSRTTQLAPWQLHKVQTAMRADLASPPQLRDLAHSCKLSLGHFSRAFKSSTGITPHQWLTTTRIQRAQAMMLHGETRLVDIADECGFADQSHFTRSFVRCVGISPGAWRRQQSQVAYI